MDKRRVNIRAIIWHDSKLLAVKHRSKDGGESSYWALPGGGLDPLESITDGIQRELLEETGVTSDIGKLLYIQQLKSGRQHRDEELEFFFHVTNPESFTAIDLTKTTHGMQELARCEFIDPTTEYILPDFLQTVDIQKQIESDQPVSVVNYLDSTPI
ncbi:NUDIX domain-containing protein [bacterium]|nr:MAG: NUDIX domain-containing protein [bacterium]